MCVSPDVPVEVADGTATVYLDRPDAGNRVSERLATGIRDVFDSLEHDDRVRVVVIAGRGEAFCLGSDPPIGRAGLLANSRQTPNIQPYSGVRQARHRRAERRRHRPGPGDSPGLRFPSGLRGREAGPHPGRRGTAALGRRYAATAPADRPGPGDGDGPYLARPSVRGKRWRWALWTWSPGETRP